MKKTWFCLLCVLVMTLSWTVSLAATMPDYSWYYATLNQRISSRTGPGTQYDEDAFTVNSIGAGTSLRILSKSYDAPNERWWVQTEITYQGVQYRVYTGEQRFSYLDLNAIPTEYQLGECYTGAHMVLECYAGPGRDYQALPSISDYTSCTIWGYEENVLEDTDYIQVEYYDYTSGCYRRCWCAEWWMDSETMYDGWPSPEETSVTPQPQITWPIGTTCRVISTSGNARSGPGTDCSRVGYVNQGQEYEILDVSVESSGKDWYLITGNFGTGWVSSGIVSVWLNGTRYDYGTRNLVPIE